MGSSLGSASCSDATLNQRPKPSEPWCVHLLHGTRRAASFPGARLADGHVIGASYTGLPFLCSHSESSGLRVSALSLRSFLRNVPRRLPQGLVWLQGSRTLRWLKDGIVYACEPRTALAMLERPADQHCPCHLAGGGCRRPRVAPATSPPTAPSRGSVHPSASRRESRARGAGVARPGSLGLE